MAFIVLKFSHIELSLHKLKLASKPIPIHNTEGNRSPVCSFHSRETLSSQSWLAYWQPQLDPHVPSFVMSPYREKRRQRRSSQSLAHNSYLWIPCNFSIPWADSHSARPECQPAVRATTCAWWVMLPPCILPDAPDLKNHKRKYQ